MRLPFVAVAAALAVVAVMAAAAPIPKTAKPSAVALQASLGQPPVSPEVKTVATALGSRPTFSYAYWDGTHTSVKSTLFYLTWKDRGIDLSIEDNRVTAAWLYNQDADGHARYVGELPDGLTFDDNLDAVAKKLGPADEEPAIAERRTTTGTTYELVIGSYRKGTVDVQFHRPKGDRERIHAIALHATEK